VRYIVLSYLPDDDRVSGSQRLEDRALERSAPTNALADELTASGELVYAVGLADPTLSQTVEIRNGRPVVTDGPDMEAASALTGFEIVDVASHERALQVAARSAAVFGRVVMRPLAGHSDGDDE
jgi:hypothetical protein